MSIATDAPWAAELMRTTYAPLRCPRCADPAEHVALTGCEEFGDAFYALRDAFAQFAAGDSSCLALYGALVAYEGRAALLLGPARTGKTILALNMAYLGADFLGDETALIDLSEGTVSAVPRRPAVRESGLPFLLDEALRTRIESSTQAHRTERGRFWYGVEYDAPRVHSALQQYPLHAVFLLGGFAATPMLEPLSLAQLMSAVARRLHGGERALADVARLHGFLRKVRGYRLYAGPPEQTAQLVIEALT